MENDLKNMTFAELEKLVEGFGQKKYIAGYIFSFIHKKKCGGYRFFNNAEQGFPRAS